MNTKQIRQTILDLAIRGELVHQDPTDEPASVLLERIRAEKEQLIKDKKLKRDKKDNEPIDEVPFELPEGWEWCRLGEICEIKGGKRLPKNSSFSDTPTNHIYIRVADMKNSTVLLEDLKYIDDEVFEKIKNYLISKEDLYLTIAGTIGEVGIIPNDLDGMNLTENAAKLTEIKISRLFLMYCLSSNFCRQQFFSGFHQVAQPKLSLETANKTQLPLPPLAEQHRIVEKVEQLFALVDTIETHKEQLKALVKQAKNQVLSDAIAGKLIHQDPNDEPAEELLKRIGKTTATDTPYEKLPKGWTWCRLGEVANIISGVSYNKKDISNNGIRILRGGNIQNSKVLILEDDIFISENYKNETNSVKIGDIVIVASTGSNLLIGKAGFIKKDLDNTQIGAFLRIIRPISDICSFLQLIFISDFYRTYIRDLAKGTNINNIKNEYLTEFIIPLPPLAEQHRIVQKIETYFSFLDTIESNL
jgi:type I restriction-modification system